MQLYNAITTKNKMDKLVNSVAIFNFFCNSLYVFFPPGVLRNWRDRAEKI